MTISPITGWVMAATGLVITAIALELGRNKRHRQLMAAIDNLTGAITGLTTEVNRAIIILGTPHPTDAAVQAAADQVTNLTTSLKAANDSSDGVVPPPAPAPTP